MALLEERNRHSYQKEEEEKGEEEEGSQEHRSIKIYILF